MNGVPAAAVLDPFVLGSALFKVCEAGRVLSRAVAGGPDGARAVCENRELQRGIAISRRSRAPVRRSELLSAPRVR